MPRRTLQHTLVATLAAGVLVAPPALASDGPTSSLAQTTPSQDLRGEHARDAARGAEPQVRPAPQTWPMYPTPSAKPAKAVPAPQTGGEDDVWLLIGIGLAATGIVAGSAAGVTRRHRLRARRVLA
jgi:LPXTG-motif cell wall-anchored protein